MSGDRLWVQCCVETTHSHSAPRRPPRGTYLQGAEPRGGGGGPRTGGWERHRERVLLLGKRDLHGVVLGDLEALQGVSSGPCLHLIVKLHEGDVVPPRNQPDLLEPREPERKAETSGIQPQHCPQTFKNPVSRDQECC